MSAYKKTITNIDPTVNAIGVECSMRLEHGTLDHLSQTVFRKEIEMAKLCESDSPGYLRTLAESYGMEKEFDKWEEENKAEVLYVPNPRRTRD